MTDTSVPGEMPSGLAEEQRKRIVDRHRDSLHRFGHSPAALYWSSREVQEIRFRMLCDIGIEAGDSVLDVGCGFADLKSWIERWRCPVRYTGIDLSPDILAVASREQPDARLICGDIFDLEAEPESYDWVLLSGALNEALMDEGRYARAVIARMFQLARRGAAFNLLNARYMAMFSFGLQRFDPEAMLAYCRSLSPHCELHDDYLDNDFTIWMRRQADA
jgi:SAM-dependent methyltransferase